MTESVTCKNCKNNISSWYVRHFSDSVWWKCGLAENYKPSEFNPVDGKTSGGYYHGCGIARMKHGVCGPEGKRWIPRRTKDLFIFLKRI